jgi:hypothetical protein
MNKLNFMYNGKNVLSIARDLTDAGLAEVALKIAETHPDVFAAAVLGEQPVPTPNVVLTVFGNINLTVDDMKVLREQDKIGAIKYLRATHSLSLLAAKNLTEWLARDGYVNKPYWYESFEQSKNRYWEESKAKAADSGISLGDLLKQQLKNQ